MLCTLLHSHPDVLCHHELYNPEGIFTALPLRESNFTLGSIEERDNKPLEFLERIWENSLGYENLGFKMTGRQQPEALEAICSDPGIHKIVLKRKARLKAYVSKLIAERSGVWEAYLTEVGDAVNKPNQAISPVEVDYQKLKAEIEYNEAFFKELDRRICGSRTDLYYEDILEQSDETRIKLLSALNLRDHPLRISSRRQNPQPPNKLISNVGTLYRQLSERQSDRSLIYELQQLEPLSS